MSDTGVVGCYDHLLRELTVDGTTYSYYDLNALQDDRVASLPFCLRVLLEAALRTCDDVHVRRQDVQTLLDWRRASCQLQPPAHVAFKPARLLLQDLTGVPAVADLAAVRAAVGALGGAPERVQPALPVDLVIDHSVQVDFSRPLAVPAPAAHMHDIEGAGEAGPARSAAARRAQARVRRPQRPAATAATAGDAAATTTTAAQAATPQPTPYRPPHRRGTAAAPPQVSARRESAAAAAERRPSPPDAGGGEESRQADCSKKKDGQCACKGEPLQLSACEPPPTPIRDEICPFHEEESAFSDVLRRNQQLEFERNKERFQLLKWAATAFANVRVLPPGSGIPHQVNLEYLARVVVTSESPSASDSGSTSKRLLLRPDSLVGTDSHTTMLNGLGVLGWAVGGLEAEAVLLGQPVRIPLPEVVGYRISGQPSPFTTATDIVLTVTKHLRQVGVAGKFVEFFGPAVAELSVADRATISSMCHEYGATVAFFAADRRACDHLLHTGREAGRVAVIREYLSRVGLLRDYSDAAREPHYSSTVELDLATVVPSVSGPKRPQDRVPAARLRHDFLAALAAPVGSKGFGVAAARLAERREVEVAGRRFSLGHGSVVAAAITSCTNTSSPSVMLAAGLLAQRAVARGLAVPPWIRTSLSPGSGVVTHYLQDSGVLPALQRLGFGVVGYGCSTCVANSRPLPPAVSRAIADGQLVCCGVLSGNRNFEGRIHPEARANYLASPPLVVAYALAGRVDIDFETTPLAVSATHGAVFLRDVWPSRRQIHRLEAQTVTPAVFRRVHSQVSAGSGRWAALLVPAAPLYPWDPHSGYVQPPACLQGLQRAAPAAAADIDAAHVLLLLGDNVSTDHISPAGSIARGSAAARHLAALGLTPRQYGSYGARRGCPPVMARATFANARVQNRLLPAAAAGRTVHLPSGQMLDVWEAAARYAAEQRPLLVVAGANYGCGAPRLWAARGPPLLGVRAVLAESFAGGHRAALVMAGVLPLQFRCGETAASLRLSGKERFWVRLPEPLSVHADVTVQTDAGASFQMCALLETPLEVTYYRHGGLLPYAVRACLLEKTELA